MPAVFGQSLTDFGAQLLAQNRHLVAQESVPRLHRVAQRYPERLDLLAHLLDRACSFDVHAALPSILASSRPCHSSGAVLVHTAPMPRVRRVFSKRVARRTSARTRLPVTTLIMHQRHQAEPHDAGGAAYVIHSPTLTYVRVAGEYCQQTARVPSTNPQTIVVRQRGAI